MLNMRLSHSVDLSPNIALRLADALCDRFASLRTPRHFRCLSHISATAVSSCELRTEEGEQFALLDGEIDPSDDGYGSPRGVWTASAPLVKKDFRPYRRRTWSAE